MAAAVGGLRACCVSGHKAEGTPQVRGIVIPDRGGCSYRSRGAAC